MQPLQDITHKIRNQVHQDVVELANGKRRKVSMTEPVQKIRFATTQLKKAKQTYIEPLDINQDLFSCENDLKDCMKHLLES